MVSTASDYVRFSQMLLNGGELDGVRLLSPHVVAYMTSDQLPPDILFEPLAFAPTPRNGGSFGLGFAVRTQRGRSVVLGEPGKFTWGGIWGTAFFVDPQEKAGSGLDAASAGTSGTALPASSSQSRISGARQLAAIFIQTDYGRVERTKRDRPMSAIGAGAKELPRQRGALGGAMTGSSRSDLGDGSGRCTVKSIPWADPGKGRKTGVPRGLALRSWDIGTPPQSAGNGHWWQRPLGSKSPSAGRRRWRSQRLAKGGARSQTKPGGEIAGGSQSCPWAAGGNRQQHHEVLTNISKAGFASRVMLRSAASLSDPNERTESPPIEATTTFGLPWPQILAGRDTVPPGRKNRKFEDRTSIGTRTRPHPYRVCVRSSALSSLLGVADLLSFVRVRSKSRTVWSWN
jgi:Beta-lactamase